MGSNMIPATWPDPVTGESYFNEVALYARPYWLCTNPDTYVYPLAPAPLGASSPELPMEVSHEAPFLGEKLLLRRDTAVFVKMYDRWLNRYIAKDPIHLDSITGVAGEPFFLPDPLWVEAGQDISVRYSLTAIGAISAEVKLYCEGARYFDKDAGIPQFTEFVNRKREEHLHNYLTFLTTMESPVTMGAGGIVTHWLEIPKEYWFTMKKITAVGVGGGVAPAFSIQFFDHRGERMSFGVMDSRATMGIGQNPEVFRQGWTIPPNRRIRMVITDLSAGPNLFYLTFTGAAHYLKGV